MGKAIIVTDTEVLKIRLEKSLKKNGIENVETLKSTSIFAKTDILNDIDIYIVDLDNHKDDGIEIVNLISNLDKYNNVPIIGLSQSSDVSILKEAISSGCSDFIIKPFNSDVLIYKIKRLLGLKRNEENSPNKFLSHKDTNESSNVELLWDSNFKINIKEVDEEHRAMIEKYSKLYSLMKEGHGHEYYLELMEFLKDYINTHFAHEEIIHKKNDYNLKEEHRDIHEEFKESIYKISEEINDNEITNLDLIKMNLFIKNWIIHHILIEDKKFGDFLTSKNIN